MNDAKLDSLVVYNSKFGPKEYEAEKKILFYQPESENLGNKLLNVGLFEALSKFTLDFNPKEPCEMVSTERRKHIFSNPEPDYWVVISLAAVNDGQMANGKIKQLDDCLKSVFLAVLKSWHGRFSMFYGSFTHLFESRGKLILMEKLRSFYTRVLSELQYLCFDILTIYGGLYYKQLTSAQFLDFHSHLSGLRDKVPNIQHCLAMHEGNMIFSNLNRENSTNLIDILKSHSNSTTHSLFTRPDQSISGLSIYQLHHGRCCSGIFEGSKNSNWIYLGQKDGGEYEKLQLIIYQAYKITICLLLEKLELPFTDTIKKIDAQIGPQLHTFATRIQSAPRLTVEHPDSNMQYIYFKKDDLATESTCHAYSNSSRPCRCLLPNPAMKVICHLEDMFKNMDTRQEAELICKVHNNYWVGAKSNSNQEIFIAGNPKISNLIHFNEEARKIVLKFNGLSFSD